jgi:hypothetical protein
VESIFASIQQEDARMAALVNDEDAVDEPARTSVVAVIRRHSGSADAECSIPVLRKIRRRREEESATDVKAMFESGKLVGTSALSPEYGSHLLSGGSGGERHNE